MGSPPRRSDFNCGDYDFAPVAPFAVNSLAISAILAIVAVLAISSYAAALFNQPCRFVLCAGLMDATWM